MPALPAGRDKASHSRLADLFTSQRSARCQRLVSEDFRLFVIFRGEQTKQAKYVDSQAEHFRTRVQFPPPPPNFLPCRPKIGPSDPAGIRGLQDGVEAFRRIAQTKPRFLVNNAASEKYLAQMLWEAPGRPDRSDWFIDSGLSDQPAVVAAEKMNAYVLWGWDPFLRFRQSPTVLP